jgi:hypothetical protein
MTILPESCVRGGAVWQKALEFTDGYELQGSFRVPTEGNYALAIRYNKHSELVRIGENPIDRFTVAFSIKDGANVIKEATLVDPHGTVIFGDHQTTRVLCGFEGRPGAKYDLYLEIQKPDRKLASTAPHALILREP